jgi:hypothetical protein
MMMIIMIMIMMTTMTTTIMVHKQKWYLRNKRRGLAGSTRASYRKVPCSDLGPETNVIDGVPQSREVNFGLVPQVRPPSNLSTSFPVYFWISFVSFDAVLSAIYWFINLLRGEPFQPLQIYSFYVVFPFLVNSLTDSHFVWSTVFPYCPRLGQCP